MLTGWEGRSQGETVIKGDKQMKGRPPSSKFLGRKYGVNPCIFEACFACPAEGLD